MMHESMHSGITQQLLSANTKYERMEMDILKASARVCNKEKRTTGFIVDGEYVKYYDALQNINLIDNLFAAKDGVIKSKNKDLNEIDVDKINKSIYEKRCKENPLIRNVQSELEEWRNRWSEYVLYLTGARQIGKTTELLKFAYKHYEQIIYVNLAVKYIIVSGLCRVN